jgi:IS30 family transposase
MAIPPETTAQILRLYHGEKWRCGTIARQLAVHHSTVRRVLAQAGHFLRYSGQQRNRLKAAHQSFR